MNSVVNKDVEAHLNNVFSKAAKNEERRMLGKVYKYEIYESMTNRKVKEEGRCVIKNIEYNEREDCDFITFIKWPGKAECTLSQFDVCFTYIEEIEPNSRC